MSAGATCATVWRFVLLGGAGAVALVDAAVGVALIGGAAAVAVVGGAAVAVAQDVGSNAFTAAAIRAGAAIYAQNCSACHGARMADPNAAFDLRKFPHDQKVRFVNSVIRGKHQMPPWGDLLKADDVDALWAYVVACGGGPDGTPAQCPSS